jgi:hypothetical protein
MSLSCQVEAKVPSPFKYQVNTPERCVAEYLSAWAAKNWDLMNLFTQLTWRYKNRNSAEDLLKKWYNHKDLVDYSIDEVHRGCPGFLGSDVCAEFVVSATYKIGKKSKSVTIGMRVIRERSLRKPSPNGTWGVNPITATTEY